MKNISIALCTVLALAGVTFAAASATPPRTEATEYGERVSEIRAELASIERELDEQELEQAVMTRVIELATADLEKTKSRREASRIRRIITQYRQRLDRIETDRAQLTTHRDKLREVLPELEARFAVASAEEAARHAEKASRGRGARVRELTGPARDRQATLNQLEALRLAIPAFREADQPDAVERLETAIHVRERALRDRHDEDLPELRRRAPDHDELRELLALSAELWREFGHESRAETIDRMNDAIWRPGGGQDERRVSPRNREAIVDRIERLEAQLARVYEMMRTMSEELADVKRSLQD